MATRFYLPYTGAADESPGYHADWDDTTIAARLKCVTTKIGSSMTEVVFGDDNDYTDKNILYRQYVSDPITAQTISVQTIKYQIRASEDAAQNNMYTAIGIRVVENDGSSETGVVLAVEHDNTELSTTMTNRQHTATTSEIEANENDRIVIEIGQSGNPNSQHDHAGEMSIGDDSGTDLPENSTETNPYNPWVEFVTDTIEFAGGPEGRTTKNTDPQMLGIKSGISRRLNV